MSILRSAVALMNDCLATLLWRHNLAGFGDRSTIQSGVRIQMPGSVHIGSQVTIGRGVRIGGELKGGTLKVGDNTQINSACILDLSGELIIGSNVVVSANCMIFTHSHGLAPKSIPTPSKLEIHDNAWIGANSIILPSVRRIGCWAVIGAGSVVTKDVDDGCVVAGNPARLIRVRENIIGQLD